MIYRVGTIERDRRTCDLIDQLDDQILGVLAEDYPQSVRHFFYWMTNPRLPEPVEKAGRGYRHVQDRFVNPRRARRLSCGWTTDATRRGCHTPTAAEECSLVSRFLPRVECSCLETPHPPGSG